ncbi:hypothetical protein UB37_20170, partial [Photobacterium iliopiscarium]
MLNRHCGVVVQLVRLFIGKISDQSRLFFDGNGRADALVVMLAMASPVHFTLLKKPESNDSG